MAVPVGGFLGAQLVPYGRDHDNPPVRTSAPWPSAEVEELAVAACYDCHTNETDWPWYSNVAPMSWLVQRDVDRGRDELNWSEGDDDFHDAAEAIENGDMPPTQYTLNHPEARLSRDAKDALIAALEAMDEGAEAEEEAAEEAEEAAEDADEQEPEDDDSSGRGRGRGRGGSNSGPG